MPLRLFNTYTRRKEQFKVTSEPIKIFVCGPTVYDDCHLGHARAFLLFDVLGRYLRFEGHKTRIVVNVTDVANDILRRAQEKHVSPTSMAETYYRRFLGDLSELGVEAPDFTPRASEHIKEMQNWISRLVQERIAYKTVAGIFLDVSRDEDYGRLLRQDRDQIKLRRLELCSGKKNQEDFSLWNRMNGDYFVWESPWGKGRPGWHIEDTAAAMKYLGTTYDINIGGDELLFPHHEALKAQVEPVTESELCRFWLHNGMLRVRGKKMSKSLNNVVSLRDLLRQFSPSVVRFYLLSTQYRMPMDFSRARLCQAKCELDRLRGTISRVMKSVNVRVEKLGGPDGFPWNNIARALNDDLDTPRALTELQKIVSHGAARIRRRPVSYNSASAIAQCALNLSAILGIALLSESD